MCTSTIKQISPSWRISTMLSVKDLSSKSLKWLVNCRANLGRLLDAKGRGVDLGIAMLLQEINTSSLYSLKAHSHPKTHI